MPPEFRYHNEKSLWYTSEPRRFTFGLFESTLYRDVRKTISVTLVTGHTPSHLFILTVPH
jgi:hypothetical protein